MTKGHDICPIAVLDRASQMAATTGVPHLAPELKRIGDRMQSGPRTAAKTFMVLASAALSDLKDQPSGVTQDLLVFDPGMVSCGGHHIQFNRFLIEALTPSQMRFKIFSGDSHCAERTGLKLHFDDRFKLNPYEYDDEVADLCDALAMNLLFWLELAPMAAMRTRRWMCHSLRVTNILTFAALARLSSAECHGIVVEFDHFDPNHKHHRVADQIYALFHEINKTKASQIRLTCETLDGMAYLNRLASDQGSALRTIHGHYLPAIWNARAHAAPKRSGNRPCFGFIGGTRTSRGADILPKAIIDTCARNSAITWRVQFDRSYLVRNFAAPLVAAWDALIAAGRLQVMGQGLDSSAYYGLLNSVDVLVLPYSDRYRYSSSGVFHEALFFGKVVLTMEGSTMAADLAKFGVTTPCIAEYASAAVTDGVIQIAQQLAEVSTGVQTAPGYAERHGTELDRFLTAVTDLSPDATS